MPLRSAKPRGGHVPRPPNLWRDEEGAVMIEFLIVLPFLLMIIFGIFMYMDINRFMIASQQAAGTQAWLGVAQGRADFDPSDEIGASGLPAVGSFTDYANLRTTMRMAPIVVGDVFAYAVYATGGTPFDIQGMPRNTFDKREFVPGEVGLSGTLTYQNQDYITPFAAIANSYIGNRDQQGSWVDWDDVQYMARQSILHDTYSVHYGNKAKRLRYADRFTIMRNPLYMTAGLIQTFVSGNPGVLGELGTITEDLGYESISGMLGPAEALGTVLQVLSFSEQAQPLRKLDKRMDQQHDVNGKADFGEKSIPNNRRIKTVSGGSNQKKMGE